MEFIESLERMTLADKFRKYHPSVPKKQHYKEWLMSSLLRGMRKTENRFGFGVRKHNHPKMWHPFKRFSDRNCMQSTIQIKNGWYI